MRATPRQRRKVRTITRRLMWPLFRYSYSRDAYVLRVIGNHRGPVLKEV